MKNKFIKDNDFCFINTDKFEKEQGVKRGQRVYIAGHRALPISEEDPYTQRIKFLVNLVNDGKVEFVPIYLMDPDSLKLVGKREQEKLLEKLQEQLDEQTPTTH